MSDTPTIVAGLTIAALGVVLLLQSLGSISLGFGALAPLALAVGGSIVLAVGLSRR